MSTTSLLKQTYNKWTEDKGPRLDAALAYYAIFSIPPFDADHRSPNEGQRSGWIAGTHGVHAQPLDTEKRAA